MQPSLLLMADLGRTFLVLGDDDVSRAQLAVCRELRPRLRGVLDCGGAAPLDATQRELCAQLARLPAFCDDDKCQVGFRGTDASLARLAQTNQAPSSAASAPST